MTHWRAPTIPFVLKLTVSYESSIAMRNNKTFGSVLRDIYYFDDHFDNEFHADADTWDELLPRLFIKD